MQQAAKGMDRGTADYMGMLATVMNALALGNALERVGQAVTVMSAIPMPTVCENFVPQRARRHLDRRRVVIFAAGTGNPFFTTDTTAALRAAEMSCQAIAKATNVDGVYSADPKKDPNAVRYETVTFDEVLSKRLGVMDAAAIALARDNGIPIIVFSMREPGNLQRLLAGNARATVVRVVVRNPGEYLKKQMYVRVLIESRQESTGLLVPVSAVLRDDENLPFVFVAQPDGGFARRSVTLGGR